MNTPKRPPPVPPAARQRTRPARLPTMVVPTVETAPWRPTPQPTPPPAPAAAPNNATQDLIELYDQNEMDQKIAETERRVRFEEAARRSDLTRELSKLRHLLDELKLELVTLTPAQMNELELGRWPVDLPCDLGPTLVELMRHLQRKP